MSGLPNFTPEENFRRIGRQKNLKFIVVEGIDDVPIYESCLIAMGVNDNYDIFHSGGKYPIENYIRKNSSVSNAIFIIDKDFDDFDISSNSIVSLDRYSIENYFICEDVISASLQLALSCKLQDVKNYFSLDEFVSDVSSSIDTLIKVIFYHQNYIVKNGVRADNPGWSDTFLCEDGQWGVCPVRVDGLVTKLSFGDDYVENAKNYYDLKFRKSDCILKDFPGKLLKHSLQRYIYKKLVGIKPSASAKFGNVESMKILLSASLYRSTNLRAILTPVVNFVNAA